MIKTLIIEDEKHVSDELQALINDSFSKEITIKAVASSVKDGIKSILTHKPDLVFLDIDLGDGTSFDILSVLPEINFNIIFVTGYDTHAIKAIKLGALDYLLKPVDDDEFIAAVKKAIEQHNSKQSKGSLIQIAKNYYQKKLHNKIVLKTLEAQHLVNFDDIIYCKSEGNYTTFYLENEKIIVSKPMKKMQALLNENIFLKCHQSFLVNISHVVKYINEGFLITKNDDQIPVATRRKDEVLKVIFNQ